jgi:branched-chain amino acid transport system permease protein
LAKKLVTQSYTAGEGEFFDLEREAAARLLRDGLAEFAAMDIAPTGFIAPAWLLGSEAEAAVREAGFDYTTLIAMVVCALLNYSIEKLAYRPLRNSPRLAPLITAIGVSILLQTLDKIIWKPNPKSYPSMLPTEPIAIGGAVISVTQVTILATTAIVLAGLMWLVNRTNLGRAMRATAENPRVAALMGIKPDTVISATFIIGAMLAAIAGIMWAANYGTVQHTMGFMPGLKAFVAAVMGGIGNLGGAVLGGVMLGLIEALGAGYLGALTGGFLGSQYSDIFAFIVLALVLTLRPSGLLGERVADRA